MNSITASQAARLKDQFEPVITAFTFHPLEHLQRHPAPGKWSAMQQVAHIGRYAEYFRDTRLSLLLSTNTPSFGRYRAEEDEAFQQWLQFDRETLLQQFHSARKALADQLLSLSPDQLTRRGRHPLYGELAIPQWIEFFLLHEAHHLYALFGLLNQPAV